jgi:hypothetical protein
LAKQFIDRELAAAGLIKGGAILNPEILSELPELSVLKIVSVP